MKPSPSPYKSPPRLRGLFYDRETIFHHRDSGKILCMRLDLSYECNLGCVYCYAKRLKSAGKREQTYEELLDTIGQGLVLGMKSVVLLGGEPLLYPYIFDMLKFLHDEGVVPVLFTNGSLLNATVSKRLYDIGASVIVKFDGFGHTQDELCGEGAFGKLQAGLKSLVSVGYSSESDTELRLGCASVVTNINYHEIPEMWRYFRNNNIFPHIERITVTEKEQRPLAVSSEQAKRLNATLRQIDEHEYGIRWDSPYPAIPGFNCSIFYAGCHINPYREVSTCPELPPVASLRCMSLIEILQGAEFKEIRNIDKNIRGKCATCPYLLAAPCYGCRSKAYQRTGSIFDEDADCPLDQVPGSGSNQ